MHLLHFTQKVLTSDITLVFYNSAGKRSIGGRLWPFYRARHRPQKRCGFPSYKAQSWEWNPTLLTALIQKIRNPLSHIRKCSPRLILSLSSLSHFSLTSNDCSGHPRSTWLLALYRISYLSTLPPTIPFVEIHLFHLPFCSNQLWNFPDWLLLEADDFYCLWTVMTNSPK